ncbi:M28 family peptidase [Candidatus Sumerlaeota bacterium]|nr:M28 family peptidase [Candidatus Sumerlaeota bacterium]
MNFNRITPPARTPIRSHDLAIILIFFCGIGIPEPVRAAEFDSGRAMADIRTQCNFGARVPGTSAHAACRDWIKGEMEKAGLKVMVQDFKTTLPLTAKRALASNIWGFPAAPEDMKSSEAPLMVLSAHWDTRPVADRDAPEKMRMGAFLGANDGAAGVAVILGIARAIKDAPLAGSVVVVFFDAEDSGIESRSETYCLGAQYAADHLPDWFKRVRLGVNLDMIGGKDLQLRREAHSEKSAPDPTRRLWRIGRDLAPEIFLDATVGETTDDHVPFIQKGVPYMDLIGWGYPQWHRLGDLPAACDPRVMHQVATVLMEFIRREMK